MQTLAPSAEQTGRPKSFGIKEDSKFFYSYNQRGVVTKTAKSSADEYYWFLTRVVLYGEKGQNTKYETAFPSGAGYTNVSDKIPTRQTPITEFEKVSGIGATNIFAIAHSELPDRVKGQWSKSGSHGLIMGGLNTYMNRKIEEKRLKDLAEAERLARELALIRPTAKPKKEETVFVAPPEIVENPISYSPLLIAGVIVVIVIILRRGA